jgi:release factor glutamine methyltransferase
VNCRRALTSARKTLDDHNVENSSLETEILLRFVLGLDRATLYSNPELAVSKSQYEKYCNLVERRCWGEPSAYITGHKEFYGLDFKIDRRVLVPRPETELLVEKGIAFCQTHPDARVADIGTGSGCIAISLAKNVPDVKIYAADRSMGALEAAEENLVLHKVKDRIELMWGDLLKPLPEPVDLILANLPYVKKDEVNAKYEPEIALDGGMDGLDAVRELIKQLPGKLNPGGFLLMEIGMGQAEAVTGYLHKAFPGGAVEIFKDLAGIERVAGLRLTA